MKIATTLLAAAFGIAISVAAATHAEAKGGRGKGLKLGHHKYKTMSFTPPGWSKVRKVGWRGGSVPPGHARRW